MPRMDLTAAIARYTKSTAKTSAVSGPAGLQQRAWEEYQRTPEVRFAANWIANGMSRVRLKAGRRMSDGTIQEAAEGDLAAELVSVIAGGRAGQSEMLRLMGLHLVVAGECWIVIVPREGAEGEDWHVLSVLEVKAGSSGLEMKIKGQDVKVKPDENDSTELHLDGPIPLRVWQPNPARFLEADSPVLGSLEQLEELRLLGASIKSTARSRLAGRGVILFPQGTRFPVAPGQGDAEDDLISVFMEVAETAIREPESAAASVPILLEVPGESIGQVQHLTFDSPFDDKTMSLREEQINRFANALDIPSEILTGQSDLNHWSLYAQQAEAVEYGILPRANLATQALTEGWLWPLLEAEGQEDFAEWVVFADTSDLRTPTNRAQTAIEVYDRGVISPQALRRETGFDEADAPTGPLPAPPGAAAPGGGAGAPEEDAGAGSGSKSSGAPSGSEGRLSDGGPEDTGDGDGDEGGGLPPPPKKSGTKLPVSETGAPPDHPDHTASLAGATT